MEKNSINFTNDKTLYFQNKYAIWIYVLIITVSVSAALLAVKNIRLTPDSITYSLVSQQIIAGNGLKVPMIFFERGNVPVNGMVPLLIHPPLLPIMLALLGGVTPQSYLAAQILNVVCYMSISIFTFLLMRIFCDESIALLTAILVSISTPLLYVTHHIWTEPLFIALTVAAIYFLVVSRHSEGFLYRRNLFIAGICASAAIMTKYSGITLLVVFFWEAVLSLKNKRLWSKYKYTILAMTLPVITMVIIFARNYIISGLYNGYSWSIKSSYQYAIEGAIKMFFLQFLLGKYMGALIVIFMVVFILYILLNVNLRRDLPKYFHSGMDLILIFIIGYLALIVYTFAEINPKLVTYYMAPLVPFLFIITIFIIVFTWERIRFQRFHRLSQVGIILFLSIITLGNCYKTYLFSPELFDKNEPFYSILHSCTYNWVIENYKKNTIIATNNPFNLSWFGGYSTVSLSWEWYENDTRPEDIASEVNNMMVKAGAQVIVLFKKDFQWWNEFTRRFISKIEDNDALMLTHECSDGLVYALKK